MAVLPYENQSGDASLDWLADAVPHVVVWQQAAAPGLDVTQARNGAAAVSLDAHRVLRGTIERERGGKIRLDSWLEDRATRRQIVQRTDRVSPDASLLAALSEIAASLGAPPRRYATANVAALRALMQARALIADPAAAHERFGAALAADPQYAAAHLSQIEYELARRDVAAAREALAAFRRQSSAAPPDALAEADQVEATLGGDAVAAANALQALAVARPGSVRVQIQAAERAFRLLPPKVAVAAWQRVLRAQPGNADGLRMLAYAQAATGEFNAARATLDQYRVVAPQDLNVLDSRAEIEYQAGRFIEASAVFAQLASSRPADAAASQLVTAAPFKAAYALLMAGDLAGANATFARGLARRRMEEPVQTAVRASWLFQSGQRDQAFALVQGRSEPALAAQECFLYAGAGQWEPAAAAAARAGAAGAFCGFLAQPPVSPEEWRRRAALRFADPQLAAARERALGYALALRGHCAAAIAPLRAALNDAAVEDNTEVRVLLGRCYLETKQWPQMREVLAQAPLPPTAQPVFSPLIFPAQVRLRADVERHFERAAEAKRWFDLYQRLGGR